MESDVGLVVHYSPINAPRYLHDEAFDSALNQQKQDEFRTLYDSGYYRFDPFYKYWREVGDAGAMTLRCLEKGNDEYGDYYNVFHPQTGMADDLGLLLPTLGRQAIGIFVSRATPFSEQEIEVAKLIYPLILDLHKTHDKQSLSTLAGSKHDDDDNPAILITDSKGKHSYESKSWTEQSAADSTIMENVKVLLSDLSNADIQIGSQTLHREKLDDDFSVSPSGFLFTLESGQAGASPISFDRAFNEFCDDSLSKREQEVARLILMGKSNSAIANELFIGEGTVKNHRKHIYSKLDIQTERTLFSQFLNYLMPGNEGNFLTTD